MNKIPLVDLLRQYHSIKKDIDSAVSGVLESGSYILGQNVKAFEQELAQYFGVKHAIGVGSGTDALIIALRAMGLNRGDEAITSSYTFIATAYAIIHNNARPKFVDIDPNTYTLDTSQISGQISSHTKAIIPVQLYGQSADMDVVMDIAKAHNLYVVEDAAQAHGSEYKGKKVGSIGDIGCFSFYPSKNLGAFGDGGAIVTSDDKLAEKARMLRQYGGTVQYYYKVPGYNSRLDEMQAAILRVKLRYLDDWNEKRRANAKYYSSLLSDVPQVVAPSEAAHNKHVYHVYVIRAKDRNRLREFLASKGVATGIHYPVPVHKSEAYTSLGYKEKSLKFSEMCADEVLSLPMFPELSKDEIDYVCECVRAFY